MNLPLTLLLVLALTLALLLVTVKDMDGFFDRGFAGDVAFEGRFIAGAVAGDFAGDVATEGRLIAATSPDAACSI